MFKVSVILFISLVFALIAYRIVKEIQSPAPSVSHTKIKKKENTPQRRSESRKKDQKDTVSKSQKRMSPPSLTRASLAENLEAIRGEIGDPVFIRIFKEEAELEIWMKEEGYFHLLQVYPICAFSGHLGPKLREGDRQSPEGFYYVSKSRLNPNSRFHLSFNLGYPNKYDRAHGRTGSFLMVHGDCVSIGCYAMTDNKIEEIYELVERALAEGQKIVRVHAFPFRMSAENMRRHHGGRWRAFWQNLKEGYDAFEKHKIPPNVGVKAKIYTFD